MSEMLNTQSAGSLGANDQALTTELSKASSVQALRDFALIRRILVNKEEQAYTELLTYYRRPVYHLVHRMVPQQEVAEDLTMEVLARACQYLPRFQPVYAFSSWLFRIATNYCIDFLRQRQLQTVSLQAGLVTANGVISFFDLPDAAPTPQEALMQEQRHAHLRRAVAELPNRYQRLVEMHYFEGLSYAEIAARHCLPLGTVKGHLHRGRELLAQRLPKMLASI